MHKKDIIVTTPEKSIIYAIGTKPESSDKVWVDPKTETWRSGQDNWKPGYVLEVREDSGFALVLTADHHPDATNATYYKQATALDALDFTLKDFNARKEVMQKYSHWPLSPEQRVAKDEELAEITPIPEKWQVKLIRTTYVRKLWAEYSTQLDAKTAEARDIQARKKEAEEKLTFNREFSINRLVAISLVTKDEAATLVAQNKYNGNNVHITTEIILKLVNGYHVPVSETSLMEVRDAAKAAFAAADGDSNDDEIQLLHAALEEALNALGIDSEGL